MEQIHFTREDADRLQRMETILTEHLKQEDKDRSTLVNNTSEIRDLLKIQNSRISKVEGRTKWIMGVGAGAVGVLGTIFGLK